MLCYIRTAVCIYIFVGIGRTSAEINADLNPDQTIEKAKNLKRNALLEDLNHQLSFLRPFSTIVSSLTNRPNNVNMDDGLVQGRFINSFNGLHSGIDNSRLDMLFDVLRVAVVDLDRVCDATADKFEQFVIDDERNLRARQAGSNRLHDILNQFQIAATDLAYRILCFINCIQNGGLLSSPTTNCRSRCNLITIG